MRTISMDELYQQLDQINGNKLILDVRSPEEFRQGHVKGSRNIPHDQVEAYVDELKEYDEVYVHCRAGGRAQMAFETLQKQGLGNLVCIADSGMKDWLENGYPVETKEGPQ